MAERYILSGCFLAFRVAGFQHFGWRISNIERSWPRCRREARFSEGLQRAVIPNSCWRGGDRQGGPSTAPRRRWQRSRAALWEPRMPTIEFLGLMQIQVPDRAGRPARLGRDRLVPCPAAPTLTARRSTATATRACPQCEPRPDYSQDRCRQRSGATPAGLDSNRIGRSAQTRLRIASDT